MKDDLFKEQVLSKEISFQNGTTIIGVLEKHRKLDEAGNIIITGYSVTTVLKIFDDDQVVETSQGREYTQAKNYSDSQNELFE